MGLELFLIVGLGLMVGGVYFVYQGRKSSKEDAEFKANAARAMGVVTDLRFRHSPRIGGPRTGHAGYWVPVVRFELPDGRPVEAEAISGSNPAPFKTGDEVPVSYDPADPTRFSVTKGIAQPSTVGVLFVIIGIFIALGGLGSVVLWFLLRVVLGLSV